MFVNLLHLLGRRAALASLGRARQTRGIDPHSVTMFQLYKLYLVLLNS